MIIKQSSCSNVVVLQTWSCLYTESSGADTLGPPACHGAPSVSQGPQRVTGPCSTQLHKHLSPMLSGCEIWLRKSLCLTRMYILVRSGEEVRGLTFHTGDRAQRGVFRAPDQERRGGGVYLGDSSSTYTAAPPCWKPTSLLPDSTLAQESLADSALE